MAATQVAASAETRPTLTRRQTVLLVASLMLGTALSALDTTIVGTAMPTIVGALGGIDLYSWVITVYLLTSTTTVPLYGRLADQYGRKPVYLFGIVLFLAGSALCAVAASMEQLIVFRALQGIGAGAILPMGMTIIGDTFSIEARARVQAFITAVWGTSSVVGPATGALIVTYLHWGWVFLVNLPVGVAAIAAAHRLLPEARPQLGQRLDLRGLALLSPGIAVFLYGVSEAGSAGGFANAGTLVAALLGLALVAVFVGHARGRGRAALIDLSLFARRGFATAAAVNFLLPAALFGTLLLIPLYYQLVRHESPLQIGLLLVPQGIGAALAMPLAGYLTDRIGARFVVTVGVLVAVVGTLAYTQLGAETSYAYLGAALFVLGIGAGSTIMPSMAAAFQALAREETPRATSALNVIQRTAGAIGTALLAIVLQRAIAANLPGGEGGIQALATPSSGERAAVAGPITDAFATTFWIAAALIALALVPALLLPRARAYARPEGASPANGVPA